MVTENKSWLGSEVAAAVNFFEYGSTIDIGTTCHIDEIRTLFEKLQGTDAHAEGAGEMLCAASKHLKEILAALQQDEQKLEAHQSFLTVRDRVIAVLAALCEARAYSACELINAMAAAFTDRDEREYLARHFRRYATAKACKDSEGLRAVARVLVDAPVEERQSFGLLFSRPRPSGVSMETERMVARACLENNRRLQTTLAELRKSIAISLSIADTRQACRLAGG